MLTFQVEHWRDQRREEMDTLFLQHWEEIALEKTKIPLDVDYERYAALEQAEMLHIVTARLQATPPQHAKGARVGNAGNARGRLVGYHCSIIDTHLHYRGTLMALTDVYFLLPEHRRAATAVRLFRKVEETLRERGVTKIIGATKLHSDKGKFLESLGWVEIERIYTKML